MAKLTAAEVLYMADGGLKRCDRCVFWHSHADRCALIDPETPVKAAQVCGLYVNGQPMTAESAVQYSSLDPKTVDLGPGNTSCGNCRFGGGETCGNPDLDGFPIDNKGGCCNAWEASTRESNPNHDPHSGEFTSGGGVATAEPSKSDTSGKKPKAAKSIGQVTEEARTAIANTPGAKANEDGSITLDVSRYQDPDQFGRPSLRTGVFFLPELKSPWGRHYKGTNKMGYGGTERVEGRTTLMKPFVVKASTGGTAVVRAYDAVKGAGAYDKMRMEAITPPVMTTSFFGGKPGGPDQVEAVKAFLTKYGGEPKMAEEILAHSKGGNLLPYALQEHVAAHVLRAAGYDSVLGYSKHKGEPRLAELFDLRKREYPKFGVKVEAVREAEFDPEEPLSAAERAARVASGEATEEDVQSAAIDAAQAAADKVRDWVNTRLDKGARAVATLYKKNRDGLVGKIRQIYDNFLGEDPTLVQARQVGALDSLNRIITDHTNRLADEVGTTSVGLIADMVGQHPKIVNRFYSPVLGADLDIPTPKPYQTVLGELTTSVVGGGTYFDRLLHINQGMKDQIFHATRQSLIAGSGFEPLRNNIHRIFGVDDLPEPKSNAYGSINTYENEARRQWNALMDETGKRSGQKSVWFSMIPDPDTTPGCAARHGMLIEDLDAPPPRHGNCRCEVLVVDADWDLDAMQTEAAEYLKTQGYTIDSALAEESQARKRFKHVLREAIWIEECLEADFDPSEHPRDDAGKFENKGGPTPVPKKAQQMRLDLGDSGGWVPKNPADRERQDYLEERKTQAIQDLGKTFEEIKGEEITVPGPSTWESLPDDAKSEIQNQWENDHFDEIYGEKVSEWKQSGEARRAAEEDVAGDHQFKQQVVREGLRQVFNDDASKADPIVDPMDKKTINSVFFDLKEGNMPPALEGKIDDDQHDKLCTHVQDRYDKEVEDREEDMDPPDSLKEDVYEELSDAFYNQHNASDLDELAKESGPGDDHVEIEEPKNWILEDPGEKQDREPGRNYNQDRTDYQMTKAVAHALLVRRAEDMWKEEHPDKEVPDFTALGESFWEDWKRDSFHSGTLGMHDALVNELGANTIGREKDRFVNPKTVADKLLAGVPPEEINKELEQGVKHKPEEAVYAKALWDTTQYLMSKAKMPDIDVYRAIMIDGKDLAEDKYKQVPVTKDVPPETMTTDKGETVQINKGGKATIGIKLPDLPLKQNPAQSFTLDPGVANHWNGVGKLPPNPTRVVIRAKVPSTAVWSLPVYGKNVQGENEVVVLGTPWKKWDAWKDRAPTTKQSALEAQRAMRQDGSMHTGSGLVIDLSDPRQTGGKHWLYHNPDGSRKVTRAKTKTREADFKPEEHPRDEKGEFTFKGVHKMVDVLNAGDKQKEQTRDRTVSEFEKGTKTPGRWTEGSGSNVDTDNERFSDREAAFWGATHSGSTAITGAAAKIMGIDGYEDTDPDGKFYHAPRLAKKMLQGIYASPGSNEALFHGFQNTEKIDWKVGDTITLPVIASTGDPDHAPGYGIRSNAEDQEGESTMFAFPKGTPMLGYQKWNKSDAKDFGHVWSEALVAGKFKVVGFGEYENYGWTFFKDPTSSSGQNAGHVITKVVKLEPVEKYNPDTKEWVKIKS